MTRRELIDYCLTYPDAYEDYPFDDTPDAESAWAVLRHRQNRRSFAFVYHRDGLCINLKCDPPQAYLLRQLYRGVTPAYHMNKIHWNTVRFPSDVSEEELYEMIRHSWELTKNK